ncbi:MAG: thioredoxin domain-containing protein [Candidatus Caenarcaniphilales bacterium]|jgi:protein-disulfide isomerase|nr:thioredoxin domain-containing protein [Candidatus Caenarcaniphilales bacterium]
MKLKTSLIALSSALVINSPCLADDDFSQKVLDVIRQNPQTIVEVLTKYRKEEIAKQEEQQLKELIANPYNITIGESPILGKKDAKYTLVIFSDFECPYCRMANNTIDDLKKIYGENVSVVFKNFPLSFHPNAKAAAYASLAAHKQNKFWQYHDALWLNQEDLNDATFIKIATELSLDLDKFNKDRSSEEIAKAVEKDMQDAELFAIDGTPAFFINGIKVVGVQESSVFEKIINKINEKAPN